MKTATTAISPMSAALSCIMAQTLRVTNLSAARIIHQDRISRSFGVFSLKRTADLLSILFIYLFFLKRRCYSILHHFRLFYIGYLYIFFSSDLPNPARQTCCDIAGAHPAVRDRRISSINGAPRKRERCVCKCVRACVRKSPPLAADVNGLSHSTFRTAAASAYQTPWRP